MKTFGDFINESKVMNDIALLLKEDDEVKEFGVVFINGKMIDFEDFDSLKDAEKFADTKDKVRFVGKTKDLKNAKWSSGGPFGGTFDLG